MVKWYKSGAVVAADGIAAHFANNDIKDPSQATNSIF